MKIFPTSADFEFYRIRKTNNRLKRKHMKKLLTLTGVTSIGAILALMVACQSTATAGGGAGKVNS
jgi:hypothetical protein